MSAQSASTIAYASCLDPVFDTPLAIADLRDPLCRQAVRVIQTALTDSPDMSLSGPQFGLPINIMGVRKNAITHILLNPRIVAMGMPMALSGYQHPISGDIRRDLWRFGQLSIEGTSLALQPIRLELEERLALSTQDAIACLQNHPFDWLTPYHRMWLSAMKKPVTQFHASVNNGLYTAPKAPDTGHELIHTDHNRMGWRLNDSDIVGSINGLNPMLPIRDADRMLLLLALSLTRAASTLVNGVEGFGLMVALRLMRPDMALFIGASPWPMAATRQLGLGHAITPLPLTPQDTSSHIPPEITLDTVIFYAKETCFEDRFLQPLAARLTKTTAGLLILSPSIDPELEDRLKRRFQSLHAFVTPQEEVIYVARQSNLAASEIWARLAQTMAHFGMVDELKLFVGKGFCLRKDGERIAL